MRVSDVLPLILIVWVLPGAGLWQDSLGWLHCALHREEGEADGLKEVLLEENRKVESLFIYIV